jgi:hypothetical protein
MPKKALAGEKLIESARKQLKEARELGIDVSTMTFDEAAVAIRQAKNRQAADQVRIYDAKGFVPNAIVETVHGEKRRIDKTGVNPNTQNAGALTYKVGGKVPRWEDLSKLELVK